MYIDEELRIPNFDDPVSHLNLMLKNVFRALNDSDYREHVGIDFFALLETINFINRFCIKANLLAIELTENDVLNDKTVYQALSRYYKNLLINSNDLHNEYFEVGKYEFSNDEFDKLETSLNTLKQDIRNAKRLTEEHKERLIEKVNKVQCELAKKMSSLDKTLGRLITVAKALGVAGKESKPAFDRINETINLISKVQDKGDSLPSVENQISFNRTPQVEIMEE